MKFKDAVKDANKALKDLNDQDYIKSFGYSFRFMAQGLRDIWYGVKQVLITISCLLVYVLLPISYPIAVIIRMVKK